MKLASDSTASAGIAFDRRRFLTLTGAAAAGVGLLVAGCASDSSSPASSAGSTAGSTSGSVPTSTAATSTGETAATTATTATSTSVGTVASLTGGTPPTTVFTAADFAALGTCTVMPEMTEGPFPTIDQLERRDITEGLGGHPLRVGVQAVDASCTPIPNAVVEIWHCDVDGDYSSYADGYTDDDGGPGTTFFRGSQTANADGIVEFLTSYPGWYTGRAVHIHAKVHVDDATVLTTQFFFADELNAEILSQGVYAAYGSPDTTNETDNIASGNLDRLLMTVSDDAEIGGSRALIVVGVGA